MDNMNNNDYVKLLEELVHDYFDCATYSFNGVVDDINLAAFESVSDRANKLIGKRLVQLWNEKRANESTKKENI